ncbi:hypothetical protein TNCV_1311911 [Trichonephila clavipes]|nr:hypothetical protein TNCV_1311911 [Trichonephila clavipes]
MLAERSSSVFLNSLVGVSYDFRDSFLPERSNHGKSIPKHCHRTNNEAPNVSLFYGNNWNFPEDSVPAHKAKTTQW